jgi:hypothetical protein
MTYRQVDDVDAEFDDIVEAAQKSSLVKNSWRHLIRKRYRPQLALATLLPL